MFTIFVKFSHINEQLEANSNLLVRKQIALLLLLILLLPFVFMPLNYLTFKGVVTLEIAQFPYP